MTSGRHVRPTARRRLGLALGAVALALGATLGAGPARVEPASAAAPSAWTGGIDLYRADSFTTQKSWLWCTAADVQIIRNIVEGEADHSTSAQRRYFDWMRDHNRYRIPAKDGIDPAGWTAGLRHFVDDRYRLTQSRTFDAALRSAVTSLRRSNLPVGITVGHGSHAWILTGFSATADPAATTSFAVTQVRVTGPLWGLQSRSFGYDMKPDTKLTPKQLAGFFTPWHYAGVRMAWEGLWVSVQPTGATVAGPTGTPVPTVGPEQSPTVTPPVTPTPTPTPAVDGSPTATAAVGGEAPGGSGAPPPPAAPAPAAPASSSGPGLVGLIILVVGAAIGVGLIALGRARVGIRRGIPPAP